MDEFFVVKNSKPNALSSPTNDKVTLWIYHSRQSDFRQIIEVAA